MVHIYVAPQKGGMIRVYRIVQTNTAEMSCLWLPGNVIKPEDERVREGDRIRAYLVVALIVAKEEELILLDRPANGGAVLPANKEGVLELFASFRRRVRAKR